MQDEATDDDRLMARVAGGDRAAYAALVTLHLDRVLAVARRVLGSRSDAEDVAQEVFLRVWTRAAEWRPGRARLSTWLYRVTVNLCIDRQRQRPAHRGIEEAAERPDPAAGAEETLAARQRQKLVEQAVAELPERQRSAVALCYTAGLSNAAAAEALDVSVGALESLLVRAKRTLRARLAGLE